jgi:hypothetical protein
MSTTLSFGDAYPSLGDLHPLQYSLWTLAIIVYSMMYFVGLGYPIFATGSALRHAIATYKTSRGANEGLRLAIWLLLYLMAAALVFSLCAYMERTTKTTSTYCTINNVGTRQRVFAGDVGFVYSVKVGTRSLAATNYTLALLFYLCLRRFHIGYRPEIFSKLAGLIVTCFQGPNQ